MFISTVMPLMWTSFSPRTTTAVSASMQGAMSPEALATMWQDVDVGLKLDTALADLLVAEADWVLSKGVVRGEAVDRAEMLTHFAPAPLEKAAPEAVDLP